jgi:hypothetical protein
VDLTVTEFDKFGEAMQILRERLDEKNIYFMNPSFN